QTVTVGWSTSDGTASAPADYQSASGTLSFAPGITTRTIAVKVRGDLVHELDETFAVTLSGASNATIGKSHGLVTILDDDASPALSIEDIQVNEGNTGTPLAVQRVTLSAASAISVTVDWTTGDGSARAPSDYLAASGTLTFSPGVIAQTVTNKINGDI